MKFFDGNSRAGPVFLGFIRDLQPDIDAFRLVAFFFSASRSTIMHSRQPGRGR